MSLDFKSAGKSGWRTRSLFADVCRSFNMKEEEVEAPYWLERNLDNDDRPIMRTHFIVSEDPTGYETAIKFFGNYEHWETMLEKCSWFREAHDKWQKELRMREKSQAIKKIKEIAESDSSQALAASKYLATADYDKKDSRGRPSKAEIKGELKRSVRLIEEDAADGERIGIRMN